MLDRRKQEATKIRAEAEAHVSRVNPEHDRQVDVRYTPLGNSSIQYTAGLPLRQLRRSPNILKYFVMAQIMHRV